MNSAFVVATDAVSHPDAMISDILYIHTRWSFSTCHPEASICLLHPTFLFWVIQHSPYSSMSKCSNS